MRTNALLVASALLLSLAWAGTADAHTLTKKRALAKSLKGAERHCENDGPSCDTFSADNCRRPAASGHRRKHKVDCDVFLGGTDGTGDWECTWVDRWSIKNGSNKLRWSQAVYDRTNECHYV